MTKIYSRSESGLGVLDGALLAGFVGDFQMALLEIARTTDPSQCCETGRDVVRDGSTRTDN
jgi:hypothetical protein